MAHSQLPQSKQVDSMQRIGHLSVLPVFFNLRGKPVLVIGGREPAAWKAELLAQAGASVWVVADGFCKNLFDLAGRTDLQGKVELLVRHYDEADFSGVALVVADAENDEEAASIAQSAAKLGVPCNTIDRAEFCTFQFGSIVNRSPVIIGISTDGAAPVLGQSIRTKIESLLPQALSRWADYAREIRPVVLDRFAPGSERRQFWARFSALAFGRFEPNRVLNIGNAASGEVPSGGVNMISVHSTDPEELTLRSIRILRNADIIYCHPTINSQILDHARREAARSFINDRSQADTEIKRHIAMGRQVVLVAPCNNVVSPTHMCDKDGTLSDSRNLETTSTRKLSIYAPGSFNRAVD